MNRLSPPLLAAALLAATVTTSSAQEQEQGMIERSMYKAMNGSTSPIQDKEYRGTSQFAAKEFQTDAFKVRSAETK
ncbi:MAG: hypothetical protein WA771_04730 [Chthoniobacterales bacterium]